MSVARIDAAVEHIRGKAGERQPAIGVVLGSGLGALAKKLEAAVSIPYEEIPGFLPSTVPGHAGQLWMGRLGDVELAVMQGRIHLYEGHPVQDVVFPLRVLGRLGADPLIITNAAGAVNPSFSPGELMLITDHLNLTGQNPLVGANLDELGPRFPDLSQAYDPELREVARSCAQANGLALREGVYAGLLGPSYETPAEIKMLSTLGADAVGMSTVLEVVAARHMGRRVLGLSCISNLAAGLSGGPLTHEEVKETADAVEHDFFALISGIVAELGKR